ncbi:lipopolysaccharide biosynthesis protein [Streptomyces sp. NPDC059631]|uniref:lipopolysaccharide biosynthesis protein n=1 Tax=unclassified Streptomyces TaxID=2593676 RepID=UPI0036AF01D9
MTEQPPRPRRLSLARVRRLPPWSLVAAGTVAGGLLGGAYGVLAPPVYSATSYVVAVPDQKSDPAAALGFAQAYGRVATQVAVLGDAQRQAGVPVRTLRRDVRAETSPDAPMIAVTATAGRPGPATAMADAVSDALTRHAADTTGSTHISLVRFARAVRPTDPSSASPAVTGLVGASAGGLLGGLALLVRPRRTTPGDPAHPPAVPGPAPAADVHGRL